MDHCSQTDLLSLGDALSRIHAAITPVAEQESITLIEALDRVLAKDIYSSIDVPGHDNSAMDGYALRHTDIDLQKPLRIIGQTLAGHTFDGIVNEGECVRVTTGAVIPAGTDTVVMQENVQRTNDNHHNYIHLIKSPKAFENIRRAGEDITQDTLVFTQGHRITPVDIGLLASLGVATVVVYRKLRVAVVSTGDELTAPGQLLTQGKIYDSNRYALIALLQRLSISCIDLGLLPDQPEIIKQTFSSSVADADVLISIGGVSVGDADYILEVLTQIGTVNFWKIAIKPGKPFAFGTLNKIIPANKQENTKSWFFGLPGNPVSSVVTYHQLVLPALRHLAGEIYSHSILLTAISRDGLKKQPGRTDFQRGILCNENGVNYVNTTGNQSSGMLTSMAQANCYIVLARESGNVIAGDTVQVIMFDRFLK